MLFIGLNIQDFGYPTKANAVTSARMYLTLPSTYMTAMDSKVFGDRGGHRRGCSTDHEYSRDHPAFADVHLPYAKQIVDHYIGFIALCGSHQPQRSVVVEWSVVAAAARVTVAVWMCEALSSCVPDTAP